ncbi:psychosine receptor [Biomphalaria pfeifferi]|uniref:Psychosine receptor n=1 Tax=Biomphalaria pfeifferi TaxID=112525 RepID=A0AAD8BKL9_BIOPF|nr:psychosine receptor [Biomphalaria pfeifferi]
MNISQILINQKTTKSIPINSLISDFFNTFNLLIVGEVIGILGIIGNVFTIRNFYKQGFRDTVSVTLTALALSDIGALVTQQGYNIMVNPWLSKMDLDFALYSMVAVFFFYPNGYFIRVSGLITAFASFERCVSVTLPLKVRLLFSRKVVLIVNVLIFFLVSIYLFPLYYFYCVQFVYVFNPLTNRTLYTLKYRENADIVLHVSYLLVDLAVPYFTFLVTIVSAVVIIVQLRSKAKWRSAVVSGKTQGEKSDALPKEKRTSVMLVTVSLIFIVCLIPHSAVLTALSFVKELKLGGPYFNIAFLCYTFTFLMETINCSVSILVYYKMSTKFRTTAQEMLKVCKGTDLKH